MTEEGDSRRDGPRPADEWRPPPPSIGTPVLLMVFMTAATFFNFQALMLSSSPQALKVVLIALTLALPVYGWWLLARSRRRGPLTIGALLPVMLAITAMPSLSRLVLSLAEGRPISPFDVGALASFGVALFFFLLSARTQPSSRHRRRR